MTVFDRRGLIASASVLLGVEIVAPLSRALAADAVPGFAASQAQFTPDQRALVSAICERICPPPTRRAPSPQAYPPSSR